MEMAERWKARKAKTGLPTLPTAPWKSRRKREIPTFPQFRRRLIYSVQEAKNQNINWRPWKSGNPKSGFPLYHRLKMPAAQGRTPSEKQGKAGGLPAAPHKENTSKV